VSAITQNPPDLTRDKNPKKNPKKKKAKKVLVTTKAAILEQFPRFKSQHNAKIRNKQCK